MPEDAESMPTVTAGRGATIDDLTVALAMYAHSSDAADPSRIFPLHGGASFSLNECVRVLFDYAGQESDKAA